MGLFSRKTIISVSSVIYPLGEEPDDVPDVVKSSAITAALRHTSVNTAIKSSILDGIGVKLSQGYNYAAKSYYAGMPKGLPNNFKGANDPLLQLLCKEYLEGGYPGSTIVVLTNTLSYVNDYDTIVQPMITAEYDYDFFEQEVTVVHGSVQIGAVLELAGPFVDAAHPDEVGYVLTFTNPDTSVVTIDEWYDDAYFDGAEAVHPRVLMEFTVDGGLPDRLTYSSGGSDHRLNIYLRALQTPKSGTYPAIVLKKNNVYLDNDAFSGGSWEASESWKTSNTYAKRMGLNISEMLTKIKDNEDEDDIDYAFIQPGTLIASTSKSVIKYHFNYFNQLRLTMGETKDSYDAWVATNAYPGTPSVARSIAENVPSQSVRLADPDTPESSVDMEIAWRYISYEEKSGVIDRYEIECGSQEDTTVRYIHNGTVTETYDTTKLYLRKALTDSTYAELVICGLWHENYVYKGHSVQSAVWDMFNDPEGDYGTGFLIPLDYPTLLSLSPRERVQLGQEAFHVVFNCYVAQKQKWYQTGIFKVVLFIVAIAAVVISWGSLTSFAAGLFNTFKDALIIAGATATVAAAVASIITAVVSVALYTGVSFVSKEVGEWAATHWGAFWGALIQIGAAVALTYGIGQLPNMTTMPPTKLIDQVVRTSSFITSGMSAYTQYKYEALQQDVAEWQDYIDKPNDALEQVNKLMEDMFPDLSLGQQAFMPHPETVDEFLARTLTTTDGLTGRLTAPISEFAELTLTPRLA